MGNWGRLQFRVVMNTIFMNIPAYIFCKTDVNISVACIPKRNLNLLIFKDNTYFEETRKMT